MCKTDLIEAHREKSMLNIYVIILIKRANVNISVPGISLFTLISISCSSPTCSVLWELNRGEGRGLLQDRISQLCSICIWPAGGTEWRWRAWGREKPGYFNPLLSASCGISHRGGTFSSALMPLTQAHLVPPSARWHCILGSRKERLPTPLALQP